MYTSLSCVALLAEVESTAIVSNICNIHCRKLTKTATKQTLKWRNSTSYLKKEKRKKKRKKKNIPQKKLVFQGKCSCINRSNLYGKKKTKKTKLKKQKQKKVYFLCLWATPDSNCATVVRLYEAFILNLYCRAGAV